MVFVLTLVVRTGWYNGVCPTLVVGIMLVQCGLFCQTSVTAILYYVFVAMLYSDGDVDLNKEDKVLTVCGC